MFECWFDICDKRLKFSIAEFAFVSGLNCSRDYRNIFYEENRLIDRYFSGLKKINKQYVQEYFISKHWDYDVNYLKIAVIYFIELFLFSSPLNRLVSKRTFDIVESSFYNKYRYSRDVYDVTFESLKGKIIGKEKKQDGYFYKLNGFPYTFQV